MKKLSLIGLVLLAGVMAICIGCADLTEKPIEEVPWTGEGPPPPPKPGTKWVFPEESSPLPTPTPIPTPTLTPTPSPTATPTPTVDTFKHTITGSADKTSSPFRVTTEEWVIDWSYEPDREYPEFAVFGFFIYPRGETAIYVESVAVSGGDTTKGSTYSYAGEGEYYLKVHCANVNKWKVIISSP